MKRGKRYKKIVELVDKQKYYVLDEAIQLVKKTANARFNETVELAARLGVDLRHADQAVRGTVSLPHGTGKAQARVLAFAQGEKAAEAESAGADYVGGEELVKRINEGWFEFDVVVATPDMMRIVVPLGRILGPRGLMPSPRAGTVTTEIGQIIREVKGGRVEWSPSKRGRIDREGAVLHVPVGKASFTSEQPRENVLAMVDAIMKARPPAAKGRYLRNVSISSTMGPGIKLDIQHLIGLLEA